MTDWRGRFATAATRVALAVGLVLIIQCGPTSPSGPVTGNWRYLSRSRIYEMSLTQTGNRIAGVACTYPLGVIRPTPQEAQVTGWYPFVRFIDPVVSDCTINATFERDRDQIAGDCGSSRLVRFERAESGWCNPLR